MNENLVTIRGNVVADPESRVTKAGAPFTSFRVASTIRRRNPQGAWEDVQTSYYNVTAFRALGMNVAASLEKGDPVIVYGRQRVNQWQRDDESYGTSVEIDAQHVGHDLARGTTTFEKVVRAVTDPTDRLSDPNVQAAMEQRAQPGGDEDDYEVVGDGEAASTPDPWNVGAVPETVDA
ncbi:single-stranded DNA-binding protein [Janibacter sp. G56]|uniref:single-stranded DNA-binding protein n=1 Tax=Janibacter sp. G56 TaxID=3418717 RepID=UPI003CFD7FC1